MKRTLIFILILLLQSSVFAKESETQKDLNKREIELVFVLDTTGSMSGLIKAAKDKIWSIANTMATAKPAPDIKIGIVGYRDRGDSYITTITDMTYDLDLVYKNLMEFKAQGGGDTPESVNKALFDAVHKNNWNMKKVKGKDKTYKVIFLVGDAPPHMDYAQDVKYQTTCREALKKGIIINTIQCGNLYGTRKIWQEIADLTKGTYFRVSQGGDSRNYKTPYDKDIAKKSKELHNTKVYYGDKKFQLKTRKKLEAVEEIYEKAETSSIAKRSSFNMSKSGEKNLIGSQELVDSVSKGKVKLKDIKNDELPPFMQKMSIKEREVFIKGQNEKRNKLYRELKELNGKRQSYIEKIVSKEKDKGKNSFDMKIYNSIKEQAAQKDIIYKEKLKY